jgi:hypothetical protein
MSSHPGDGQVSWSTKLIAAESGDATIIETSSAVQVEAFSKFDKPL